MHTPASNPRTNETLHLETHTSWPTKTNLQHTQTHPQNQKAASENSSLCLALAPSHHPPGLATATPATTPPQTSGAPAGAGGDVTSMGQSGSDMPGR